MINVFFKCNTNDEFNLSIFDKKKLLSLIEDGELKEGNLTFKNGNISIKAIITENAYSILKKMGIKIFIIKDDVVSK